MELTTKEKYDAFMAKYSAMSEEEAAACVEKAWQYRSALLSADPLGDPRAYEEQANYFCPPKKPNLFESTHKVMEGRPMPAGFSVEGLPESIDNLATTLFKDWRLLNAIVGGYEAQIRKRWMKRSRGQRKELLREAWSDIPSGHRPDIRDYLETTFAKLAKRQKVPESWQIPFINLEDLSEAKPLLIFLNARARHPPDMFAYSDLEWGPLYKIPPKMLNPAREKHTMAFVGRRTPQTYGQLIAWDDVSGAAESKRNGLTVHPDHGMQILRTQLKIWPFLIRCCLQIMPDFPKSPALGTPIGMQPEPPPLFEEHPTYSLLNNIARDAPYCLPTSLNLDRLRALATAHRNQLCDQIWQLREDPSCFAETVRDLREHRGELILDGSGKPHRHSTGPVIYSRVLRNMITDLYVSFWNWDKVQSLLSQWHELSIKHANEIRHEKKLPTSICDMILETRMLLDMMMLDLIDMFKNAWAASPPMRKYFFRDNPQSSSRTIGYTSNDKWKGDRVKEEAWRIVELLCRKEKREQFTFHCVMDEVERVLLKDQAVKALFTPYVLSLLSQLSVISECLHHMQMYQPWATAIEHDFQEQKARHFHRYHKKFAVWGFILKTMFHGTDLWSLGNPSDGKFDHPVRERKTHQTTDKMRAAEAALDKFWEAADAHFRAVAGKCPHDVVKDIVGRHTIERTGPYSLQKPTKTSQPKSKAILQTAPVGSDLADWASHDITKEITGRFDKLAASDKTKLKTRGTAASVKNAVITKDTVAKEDGLPTLEEQPTLPVDKRAHKVFRALFHCANSPDQPGEVAWADFLHAMVSAGFSAEKLQGSSWHFTPRNLEAERSIQFHEPHPGNKLPFTWARRYGRRLTRAFGWTANTFGLA
ncbi:hypothetical protein BU26DRAFT_84509 [Trematosphaeria pertusa]|uniref:Uncharacterized protein n=1 Tax=Trematosphaeria pertusa TaxID=390896 RepID=A0A6A6I350_9PLEO|nr:uncharacterized protein BU26DRAFT_84509 [Trematosphaeria pertusa]KAF2244696.1 hypothetical protein BU26DRAFT_84509 [Trematosphaeria pertusa]